MKLVRIQDLLDVITVSRNALECSQVDELRSEVLGLMEPLFRAESSNFFLVRTLAQPANLSQVICRGIEDRFLTQYNEHYYRLNPLIKNVNFFRNVITGEQIISFKDFMQGEYYNEFLKPQSMHYQMVVYLRHGNWLLGGIVLYRPPGAAPFSLRDKAKAELLAPQLGGALKKAMLAENVTTHEEIIRSITPDLPYRGMIVLDEQLDPVYVDQDALNTVPTLYRRDTDLTKSSFCLPEEIYLRCEELRMSAMSDGFAEFRSQQCNLVVMNGVKKDISARVCLLSDPKESALYLICFMPDEATEYLSQRLKEFDLTYREADVVHLVCQGLKNSEIADKLCISEYTVMNHLRSIYEKCGVKNRTSLAHLATRLNRQMRWDLR